VQAIDTAAEFHRTRLESNTSLVYMVAATLIGSLASRVCGHRKTASGSHFSFIDSPDRAGVSRFTRRAKAARMAQQPLNAYYRKLIH
jgi:hypothetical protein